MIRLPRRFIVRSLGQVERQSHFWRVENGVFNVSKTSRSNIANRFTLDRAGRSYTLASQKETPSVQRLANQNFMRIQIASFSTETTLRRTLTKQQEKILEKEISLLKSLEADLEMLKASNEDIQLVRTSIKQLEDLFLLVVVGEFNSGKSSFINALLGKRVLKEGITPTTSKIGILKYGEVQRVANDGAENETIYIPVDWLKEISLVDTPGTNAIIKGHQQITEHFVPRSDLILFVTSTDRAFSESERLFLEKIKQYKKKVVVVLSKLDMVDTEHDLAELLEFLKRNFLAMLSTEPTIFPVSAKMALSAKLQSLNSDALSSDEKWLKSKFGELENYILKTLSAEERKKLKLENPLGVAEHVLSKYSEGISRRKDLLRGDLATLDNINNQVEEFKKDVKREFQFQNDRVENLLLMMGQRADDYLDDKVRFSNLLNLIRSEKIKADFERDVVGDTSRDIERQVSEIIDWFVTKNSRIWKDVIGYIQQRASINSAEIMGQINVSFDYNRSSLLNSLGSGANEVLLSFNREKESQKLSSELQQAVMSTVVVEVGALGLGGLLAASLLDISGIIGAGTLAVTGLAIIPYKRSVIRKAVDERIKALRQKLKSTLQSHFDRELDLALLRLNDAISPYSRFIKTEQEKLSKISEKFEESQKQLADLRLLVTTTFGK